MSVAFDENILYYIRTRGLTKKQALSFMIKSFYSDLLEDIEDENYKNIIDNLADNWINKFIN